MQNERTGLRSQGARGAAESLRERGPPPKHLQGNENMGRGSSMAVVRQSVAGDAPSRLSSETVVDNHPAPPATADVQPAADGVRHQPPEYPYSAPCHNFARLHVLGLLSFSLRPMPRRR